jgi:hypothetical protein
MPDAFFRGVLTAVPDAEDGVLSAGASDAVDGVLSSGGPEVFDGAVSAGVSDAFDAGRLSVIGCFRNSNMVVTRAVRALGFKPTDLIDRSASGH